jgi:transcriptional antiterminator RfaH
MIFRDSLARYPGSPPCQSGGLHAIDGGVEDRELRWYVVHAKPHQEDTVESQLLQMGMEVFCPRLKQIKVIRRKRQSVVVPLFPGYLFARFGLHNQYRAVMYARGVRRVVCFGMTPAPVEDRLIEGIRQRHIDGCVTVARRRFVAGQSVKIREGSLCGLDAVFEREMSGTQRAVLLLKALSYQARVIVDLDHIGDS